MPTCTRQNRRFGYVQQALITPIAVVGAIQRWNWRQRRTGKLRTVFLRPACLSAAHMSASDEASPKGSRLSRTLPEKMIGSCAKDANQQHPGSRNVE